MALPGKHRAPPEVPPSPAPARERARLRPALGGGRGRGDGDPARTAVVGNELWLAAHLPHCVIEALRWPEGPVAVEGARAAGAPRVAVDRERGGKVVCACDVAASAVGITPGMTLNSALVLAPELRAQARDERREQALLEAVACIAGSFTPRVVLEPPDGVLLEVRGSLRLFGGVRRLHALARERLQSLGIEPRLAIAPTPLASLWFARAGEEVALGRRDALASRLAPLPLACTRWPERSLQSLATMGVRTVGDCLRLPRGGLARRFEPDMLRTLDRATGRAPDPRAAFVVRERFVARRDLEPEISDVEWLRRAIEPLLVELCAFLRQRVRGVEVLDLRFVHRAAPETRVRLRFVDPATEAGRIADLI
jgi:protein ImuB